MQPDNRQEIPVREDVNCPPSLPDVEAVAKRIYEAMRLAAHAHEPDRKTPEWVERGNSLMQDEARRVARFIASDDQTASTALVERLREAVHLLEEVKNAGLIYWEPNTDRGHVAKAMMISRIDDFALSVEGER